MRMCRQWGPGDASASRRKYPAVFAAARGSHLVDEDGRRYLDFLCGAGAVNYGHNPPPIRERLIAHLMGEGLVQALDLHTVEKRRFLERFEEEVLAPRGLPHRVQFTGPTGANAVEAALKVARKATGRSTIAAFTGGYHGMSLGALAATGNAMKRRGAGVPLGDVVRLPFDGYFGEGIDTAALAREMILDPSSGVDAPAAFLVEPIQGEGGVNVASAPWLRAITALAREVGALLIVDDIQSGCGRSGRFFGFDGLDVTPDVICLSKSLSGYGLPMSVILVAPEVDVWKPGEHNGTFRGSTPAFVTAAAALDYWADPTFLARVSANVAALDARLPAIAAALAPGACRVKGRGLLRGLAFADPADAEAVSREAFADGLVVETCGARGEVVKIMPQIDADAAVLEEGLAILERAASRATGASGRRRAA